MLAQVNEIEMLREEVARLRRERAALGSVDELLPERPTCDQKNVQCFPDTAKGHLLALHAELLCEARQLSALLNELPGRLSPEADAALCRLLARYCR